MDGSGSGATSGTTDGVIDNYAGEIPERFLCPTARAAFNRVRETLTTRHGATRACRRTDRPRRPSAISPTWSSVKFGGPSRRLPPLGGDHVALRGGRATGEGLPRARATRSASNRGPFRPRRDARFCAPTVVALDGRRVGVIFRDAKGDDADRVAVRPPDEGAMFSGQKNAGFQGPPRGGGGRVVPPAHHARVAGGGGVGSAAVAR